MGNSAEVAATMAAFAAGEPVTVMWDGFLAENHRDGGSRAFGMAQMGAGADAEQRIRTAQAERLDRDQPALGAGGAVVRRSRRR